jgi:hypothetical protein
LWILDGKGGTLVDDVVVGLSANVALSDSGEEEASDCVLDVGGSTSSPTMAISLFPSVFLKFGFINRFI